MYVCVTVCMCICMHVLTCALVEIGGQLVEVSSLPPMWILRTELKLSGLGTILYFKICLVSYLMSVSLPDSTCWAIFLGSLEWPHIYHWGFLEGPHVFYQESLFARSITQATPDSEAGCLPNLKPAWVAEWVQGQLKQLNVILSQRKGKRGIS